jgi:hypothetical protein
MQTDILKNSVIKIGKKRFASLTKIDSKVKVCNLIVRDKMRFIHSCGPWSGIFEIPLPKESLGINLDFLQIFSSDSYSQYVVFLREVGIQIEEPVEEWVNKNFILKDNCVHLKK